MSKKDKQNWLELALAAAENARKLRVSGNDPRADDWDNVAAARAAVAQAEAQTRLADNSDRIAVALERIAEPIDANIEAQENVIIALGLNPSDFNTDLMEHVINGVIGAMTQRLAELEEALDEARGGMEIHRAISAAANRRVAELEAALDAERDAHAWRPVTDDAPAPLEKVVVATRDDPDVAWRLPEVPHLWNTRRGRSLLTQEIAGYLPLPPQEPTQ